MRQGEQARTEERRHRQGCSSKSQMAKGGEFNVFSLKSLLDESDVIAVKCEVLLPFLRSIMHPRVRLAASQSAGLSRLPQPPPSKQSATPSETPNPLKRYDPTTCQTRPPRSLSLLLPHHPLSPSSSAVPAANLSSHPPSWVVLAH